MDVNHSSFVEKGDVEDKITEWMLEWDLDWTLNWTVLAIALNVVCQNDTDAPTYSTTAH